MGSLWNRSGTIERYGADDLPARSAQAFFFLGGTITPMTVYSDSAENSAHTHPVRADSNGRWPNIFVPYTLSYDVQVLNEFDVQLSFTEEIPNPNPIEVEIDVPVEERVQTGMHIWEPVQGTRAGYVRANGRTVGNASSSASERANADTSALFTYLWNNLADAQAAVTPGGRGGSAAADFAANKQIALPDLRGAMPIGLDDMGSGTAGAFTGASFGHGNATTPGSAVGANVHTLTLAQLPSHSHSATTSASGDHNHGGATGTDSPGHTHNINFGSGFAGTHTHTGSALGAGAHSHGGATTGRSAGHTHTYQTYSNTLANAGFNSAALTVMHTPNASAVTSGESVDHTHGINSDGSHTHVLSIDAVANHQHTISGATDAPVASHTHSISASGTHTHTLTTDSVGSGAAFTNIGRTILGTWYVKL